MQNYIKYIRYSFIYKDCQYPVVSRVAKSLGWKTQAGA
jgi:hypothetical protein